MRKIFKKSIAAVISTTMATTLVVGLSTFNIGTVRAADTAVNLKPWEFYQAGSYGASHDSGMATYSSVITTTGETKSGNDFNSDGERTVRTANVADGFTAVINSNGWGAEYEKKTFNPWQITTKMNAIAIEPGHNYEITFKARASQQKYAYFTIGSEFEGEPKLTEGDSFMVISTDSQEYKYAFTNWAASKTLDIQIMLGAFNAFYTDYAGVDRSEQMKDGFEVNWAGTLYISDFKIIDKGENPDYIPQKPTDENQNNQNTNNGNNTNNQGNQTPTVNRPTPTNAPVATVKKPGQVKIKKAQNLKGKKVKITWKKIKTATKYQVKVGTKKKITSKLKYTMSGLKKNKTYKVYVRAYNKAGYGKWSKVKKVKVTK